MNYIIFDGEGTRIEDLYGGKLKDYLEVIVPMISIGLARRTKDMFNMLKRLEHVQADMIIDIHPPALLADFTKLMKELEELESSKEEEDG